MNPKHYHVWIYIVHQLKSFHFSNPVSWGLCSGNQFNKVLLIDLLTVLFKMPMYFKIQYLYFTKFKFLRRNNETEIARITYKLTFQNYSDKEHFCSCDILLVNKRLLGKSQIIYIPFWWNKYLFQKLRKIIMSIYSDCRIMPSVWLRRLSVNIVLYFAVDGLVGWSVWVVCLPVGGRVPPPRSAQILCSLFYASCPSCSLSIFLCGLSSVTAPANI